MRRSGHIVRQVLDEMKAMVAPGVSTMDLEKAAEKKIKDLGAKPAEGPKPHMLSVPAPLKSELDTCLRLALRLLDEMYVSPCEVELRHVIADMSAEGAVRLLRAWPSTPVG